MANLLQIGTDKPSREIQIMNVTPEVNRNGTTVYRFRYREWVEITQEEFNRLQARSTRTKRDGEVFYKEVNKSVPQNELPKFDNLEQAKEYLPFLEQKFDSRKRLMKERKQWYKRYWNFEALVNIYLTERRKTVKNSMSSKENWFVHYTLEYFLNIRQCANLEKWKYEFNNFKNWLQNDARTMKGNKPLSYASQNHCIVELNAFLEIMAVQNKCEYQPKLKLHPERLLNNMRGQEDLVTPEEFNLAYDYLRQVPNKPVLSKIYYLLRVTGMRLNEILGIGLMDVKSGPPDNAPLIGLLEQCGIQRNQVLGHIILKHQPKATERAEGRMTWKALKGKPAIDYRYARYIPITDNQAWNILVELIQSKRQEFENRVWGNNPVDYPFFFDDVSKNKLTYYLKKAYRTVEGLNNYKSPHCLRHTKATELIGAGNFSKELAKLVLGHGERASERYNHLNSSIMRENHHRNINFDDFRQAG